MNKVIILTTSTGQGHNQAADSLKDTFLKSDYDVEVFNFLKGCNKKLDKLITTGYYFSATKTPKLYGLGYHLTNFNHINDFLSVPFKLIDKKLAQHINSSNADIIIGTHPLTVNIITRLKKHGLIGIPFISIVTDFDAHSTYLSDEVDYYITGSEETSKMLISKGIETSRVLDYGIPIKQSFTYKDFSYDFVKKDDFFTILIMGGSMGLNSIATVVKHLVHNHNKLRLIIVCGSNKSLKEHLDKEYSHPIVDKKIYILGYTAMIAEFMDVSDILISKPGGLTTTESIYKNLPMVIPFVIPGQETGNAKILAEMNCAIRLNKISDINDIVNELIEKPEKLLNIKNNIKKLGSNYSTLRIVGICNDLLYKQKQCSKSDY